MKKTIFMLVFLCCLSVVLFAQGNLPESREATFIEMSGSGEVLIKAKGIGGSSNLFGLKEEESRKLAELDARKSAVYAVLHGVSGLDGILKNDADKSRFSNIQNDFFDESNVMKFIAWEASGYDSRVKMAGGEKIKIEKQFRINKKAIVDQLIQKGIIASVEQVTEEIGLPTLMALPQAKPGESPLALLRTDALLKQGAATIESYLTAKKYNVIAGDQAEQIYEQQKAQLTLKGKDEDMSYAIALSVGSDVYITYNVIIESRKVGTTEVHKASINVRAYETTTARLLGTETGYSDESAAPPAALIEAAITNALNNVMSRINEYWKDDLKNGQQYKVIFNITGNFDEETRYDLSDAVSTTLKKLCARTKENVVSDKTIDYLVWVSNPDLQSPTGFFREIRREFNNNFKNGKMKQVNLNRKLMLLAVE